MFSFIKKFWWLVFPLLVVWVLFTVGRYGNNFSIDLYSNFLRISNITKYSFVEDINKAVRAWSSLNSKWSSISFPSPGDIKEMFTFFTFITSWLVTLQVCITTAWGYVEVVFVTFGNILVDIFTFIFLIVDFIFNPIIQ